ncbi:MAG: Na+/H+ antiporter subunit E [Candidatus Eisenbacteria bacterium]
MRRLTLTLVSFVLWFLLVWPFYPGTNDFDVQSTVLGVFVALFVGIFFGDKVPGGVRLKGIPTRIFWFLVYIPTFLWAMIHANLDVVYRVIHPDLPIRPGIVKIKTSLKSNAGRTMLANSITLTPGTITVDLTDDGYLYVHWIYVKAEDVEEATQHISGRFEKLLGRIFE